MIFRIPSIFKSEHDELHDELHRATEAGGRTGEAAAAVARLMNPHFLKEEEFALPPLGLLAALSHGKLDADMADILPLTDRLEAEMPQMLAEHREIVAALTRLVDVATAENKPDQVRIAEKLMAHARMEEEESYPAALLIGRYLRVALPHLAANAD